VITQWNMISIALEIHANLHLWYDDQLIKLKFRKILVELWRNTLIHINICTHNPTTNCYHYLLDQLQLSSKEFLRLKAFVKNNARLNWWLTSEKSEFNLNAFGLQENFLTLTILTLLENLSTFQREIFPWKLVT